LDPDLNPGFALKIKMDSDRIQVRAISLRLTEKISFLINLNDFKKFSMLAHQ